MDQAENVHRFHFPHKPIPFENSWKAPTFGVFRRCPKNLRGEFDVENNNFDEVVL